MAVDPSPPRAAARRRPAAVVAAAVMVVALSLAITGCSGSDSSSSTTTTVADVTSTAPPVTVAAYCDPAIGISVGIGQQFALALEADPTSGSSWQATAVPDPAVIFSIGTEFPGTGNAVQDGPCAQASQVLRYGGRGLGSAAITLRYGRPGAPPAPDDRVLTFTVTVIDPSAPTTVAPTTVPSTTTTVVTPTTAAARTTTTTRPRPTTTTTRARTTTTT